MTNLFDLTGRTAVVTGGSRGIGFMAARGLLEAGARVVISSRKPDACRAACEQLSEFGEISAVAADLSTEDGCLRLAGEVATHYDGVHILINNAGATWGAPLEAFPGSAWDKVVDLNLRAPFLLTRAFLPLLEKTATQGDPARVLNVGSIDGLRVPGMPTYAYSSSKAGLHHLTRVLAVELGPRITCNAIAPGPFPSKMTAKILADHGDYYVAKAPLGRLGQAEDIAGAVVYLSSPAASYVTGAVLPIDGGISLTR
ncbi:SDR family oxidoreductase [Amycolatopsis sp. NPDC049868]|uniref:SDR family oxidoreductase n=1 Tax=Amycolatopsis sp. NPDC049868 TaxID=3363934 RepID=UPI0037B8CB8C